MRVHLRESAGPARCAYCHGPIGPKHYVCRSCSTRLHFDCASLGDLCPTLGCRSNSATPRTSFGNRRLAIGAAILLVVVVGVSLIALVPRSSRGYSPSRRHVFSPTTEFNVALGEGRRLLSAGEYGAASEAFDRALALRPDATWLVTERARAKECRGDYEGALADYDEALQLAPENAFVLEARGSLRALAGDMEGSRRDYLQAAGYYRPDANETDWTAWNGRGHLRGRAGDHAMAETDCTRAIELNPSAAYPWNNRGYARLHLGDLTGAADDIEKSLAIDPSNPYAWENRANVQLARGDFESARRDFEKSLEVDMRHERRAAVRRALGVVARLATTADGRPLWSMR